MKMIGLNFVIVYAMYILNQYRCGEAKLLFLQIIFRHGNRAPIFPYFNDPVHPEFWPEGYGMLSKLGKKQHYNLGKFLRNFYRDFITSNPNEVLVNSTDLDRCIISALSHVAGLYAPEPKYTIDDKLPWQPIPVHYIPLKNDKYLTVDSECPLAFQEKERITSSKEFLQVTEKFQPLLLFLSNYLGHAPGVLETQRLSDAVFVEKINTVSLPYWTEFYYDHLREFFIETISREVDSPLMQRLRAGPLIGKIIEDMNKKIAGDIPELKVQVYSTQYHNMLLIMQALKVFNYLYIPFCATLVFELHELLNGSKAVRLLYLNSTEPEKGFQSPNVLTFEGCTEYCPIDYLINYSKHLIPQDWEKECGLVN